MKAVHSTPQGYQLVDGYYNADQQDDDDADSETNELADARGSNDDTSTDEAAAATAGAAPKISIDYLNGLRGVAAVMVFNHHEFGAINQSGIGYIYGFDTSYLFISLPFVRLAYSGGAAAVSVFFVLSGFVIVQSFLRLQQEGKGRQFCYALVSAIVRRPLRLYLPCWMIGFIVAALKHTPFLHAQLTNWMSPTQPDLYQEFKFWVWHSLAYFQPFQVHSFGNGWYKYAYVLWTIPLELKCSYLVYAVMAALYLGRSRPLWQFSCCALSVLALMLTAWWEAGCFMAGLSLALVHHYDLDQWFQKLSTVKQRCGTAVLFVSGLYLMSLPALEGFRDLSLNTFGWQTLGLLTPWTYSEYTYYRFWHSFGAMLLVFCVIRSSLLQSIFNWRSIQFLGKHSFMLYAIHTTVADTIATPYLRRAFGFTFVAEESKWDNYLFITDAGPVGINLRWGVQWTLLLSIVLFWAYVATRCVDEPCMRFSRYIGNAVSKPLKPKSPISIKLDQLTSEVTRPMMASV